MSQPRFGHSLLCVNGSLVAVGGNVGTIEWYDVVSDTWSVREVIPGDNPCGAFIMMKYYLEPE